MAGAGCGVATPLYITAPPLYAWFTMAICAVISLVALAGDCSGYVSTTVAVKATPFAERSSPCALKVKLSSRLVGAPLRSTGTEIEVSGAPADDVTVAAPKFNPGLVALARATALLMNDADAAGSLAPVVPVAPVVLARGETLVSFRETPHAA